MLVTKNDSSVKLENHLAIGDEIELPISELTQQKACCTKCKVEADTSDMELISGEYFCPECAEEKKSSENLAI